MYDYATISRDSMDTMTPDLITESDDGMGDEATTPETTDSLVVEVGNVSGTSQNGIGKGMGRENGASRVML